MKILIFILSLVFFRLVIAENNLEYEECKFADDSENAAENCSVYTLLKEAGGGFDVWEHMPKFPDYKDTLRPYKKAYLDMVLGNPFGNTFIDILYKDLEKIWGCLAKDDLECLASMTYIAHHDQFTSDAQPLDKVKKGKWRLNAADKDYPASHCKDMGEYFPGIKADYANPTNGKVVYKIEPYVAFSDPLKFFQCIFTYQPKVSPTDPLGPTGPLWKRGVSMGSYESIKNLLRSTFIRAEGWYKIDSKKSLKENYPTPFHINLAFSNIYTDSIILLYGTPANPNGFAIAGFGKEAQSCFHFHFCYADFKDGP